MRKIIQVEGYYVRPYERDGREGLFARITGMTSGGERVNAMLFNQSARALDRELRNLTPQGVEVRDMDFVLEMDGEDRISNGKRREPYFAAESFHVLTGPALELQRLRLRAPEALAEADALLATDRDAAFAALRAFVASLSPAVAPAAEADAEMVAEAPMPSLSTVEPSPTPDGSGEGTVPSFTMDDAMATEAAAPIPEAPQAPVDQVPALDADPVVDAPEVEQAEAPDARNPVDANTAEDGGATPAQAAAEPAPATDPVSNETSSTVAVSPRPAFGRPGGLGSPRPGFSSAARQAAPAAAPAVPPAAPAAEAPAAPAAEAPAAVAAAGRPTVSRPPMGFGQRPATRPAPAASAGAPGAPKMATAAAPEPSSESKPEFPPRRGGTMLAAARGGVTSELPKEPPEEAAARDWGMSSRRPAVRPSEPTPVEPPVAQSAAPARPPAFGGFGRRP